MNFFHLPTSVMASPPNWVHATETVIRKMEAFYPDLPIHVWVGDDGSIRADSSRGCLIHHREFSLRQWSDHLRGLMSSGEGAAIIYGGVASPLGNRPEVSYEKYLIRLILARDPHLLQRYLDFLSELLDAAPSSYASFSAPWMVVDDQGDVKLMEMSSGGYKKQLAALKDLIKKNGQKKTELSSYVDSFCFPRGMCLGWLGLPGKSFHHPCASISYKLIPPQTPAHGWQAIESWLDTLAEELDGLDSLAPHGLQLACGSALLDHFFYERLKDKIHGDRYRSEHLSKWLYGYDPYGRFLDFLSQGLELGAGYSHYLFANPVLGSMEIMTAGGTRLASADKS